MLEFLAAALVLVGLTIIAVVLILLARARQINRVVLELIELNENLNHDPLSLLRQSRPLLEQAGITSCSWKMDWFGTEIKGGFGNLAKKSTSHLIKTPEPSLLIEFSYRNLRGENRLFEEAVRETFLLLLRTDLWMKTGVAHATLAQMDKLTRFAVHDIKNIAQYLQLTADQLGQDQNADAEDSQAGVPNDPVHDQKILTRLRQTFPLMRSRADNILRLLGHDSREAEPPTQCSLPELVSRICSFHQIPADVKGSGTALIQPAMLEGILDNIIKNYVDHKSRTSQQPRLLISITEQSDHLRINIVDTASDRLSDNYERLFEPFETTNFSGSGIGLYQSRHRARILGGDLSACHDPDGRLNFELVLPKYFGLNP